jgi:adenylate cyclase
MKNSFQKRARRLNPLREARSLIVCFGLLLSLSAGFILFNPPSTLDFLNYRIYDLFLTTTATATPSDKLILIGIDEKSLAAYGQWPWPRYRLAQLVDKLNESGVDAIALDMLMPELDRTSPEVILHERQRDLGESSLLPDSVVNHLRSNDQILADSLSKAKTVLSYKFTFTGQATENIKSALHPLNNIVVQESDAKSHHWPVPISAIVSNSVLRGVTSTSGFTNVRADNDGILRRIPLLMKYKNRYYPSLSLATIRMVRGQESLYLKNEKYESTLILDDKTLPLDERGQLLLNFYDRAQSFPYHSAGHSW